MCTRHRPRLGIVDLEMGLDLVVGVVAVVAVVVRDLHHNLHRNQNMYRSNIQPSNPPHTFPNFSGRRSYIDRDLCPRIEVAQNKKEQWPP